MALHDAEPTNETTPRYPRASERGVRASDAEREETATTLRRHYAEGRLDQSEYEERIDRCYAAKRVGELGELTYDLPRDDTPAAPEAGRNWPDSHPAWRPLPFAPLLIALIVLGILTHGHIFWWLGPLAFFVFGPFGRRWRGGWNRHRGSGTTRV